MKTKLVLAVSIAILVAVACVESAAAQVWSVEHQHDVHCVAFSPDGKLLATGSLHNKRTRKHPGDDQLRKLIRKLGGGKRNVEFVLRRGGEFKLWDVATGKEVKAVRAHTGCVSAVAFSPDGKTLATANKILIGVKGRDRSCDVKLWDVATGKERATLTGHTSSIRSIAFSHDGKRLASAGFNGIVKIWNVAKAKELLSFDVQKKGLWNLGYFLSGKILVIGATNGSITFWNARTGKKRGDIHDRPGFKGSYSLAISHDGKMLAAGLLPPENPQEAIVRVWDIAAIGKKDPLISTTVKSTFAERSHVVGALAFSRDGKALASGGGDQMVRLWDPATGARLAALKGHTSFITGIAFSPNGKYLASVSWDKSLKLWTVAKILKRKSR